MIDVSEITIFDCPSPCCNDYETCLAVDPHRCHSRLEDFYKHINKRITKENDLTEDCYDVVDKKDVIKFFIPLGSLCYFKPLNMNVVYFGEMAGKVINTFYPMTFVYVINRDGKIFFSKEVVEMSNKIRTMNDAEKYFRKINLGE